MRTSGTEEMDGADGCACRHIGKERKKDRKRGERERASEGEGVSRTQIKLRADGQSVRRRKVKCARDDKFQSMP